MPVVQRASGAGRSSWRQSPAARRRLGRGARSCDSDVRHSIRQVQPAAMSLAGGPAAPAPLTDEHRGRADLRLAELDGLKADALVVGTAPRRRRAARGRRGRGRRGPGRAAAAGAHRRRRDRQRRTRSSSSPTLGSAAGAARRRGRPRPGAGRRSGARAELVRRAAGAAVRALGRHGQGRLHARPPATARSPSWPPRRPRARCSARTPSPRTAAATAPRPRRRP